MRIINKTHYRNDDLRSLFRLCTKHHGSDTKGMRVHVKYAKRHHGYAFYPASHSTVNSKQIHIYVPKWDGETGIVSSSVTSEPIAVVGLSVKNALPMLKVFEHELMHCHGMRHKDMSREVYHCTQDISDWFDHKSQNDFQILVRLKMDRKPTAPEVKKERREVQVQRKEKEWKSKLAIAKRQFKKWSKELSSIERKRRASGTSK